MTLFNNKEIVEEVFHGNKSSELLDIYTIWLQESSNFTSIRVNSLKKFQLALLISALTNVSAELDHLPDVIRISKDCVIVKKWNIENVLELESVPEVIVDAECGAAVLRGANVFAPGIMGMPSNLKMNEVVNIFADIDGECKRGLKTKYEGVKIFVATGKLKMLRSQLFNNDIPTRGIAIEVMMPTSKIPVLNENIAPAGEILLQNLPSIVCGWVVDAKPNEIILDMCAAPGNKTTHLAEMAQNKAKIYAVDKIASKVERIKEKCRDHAVTCVHTFCFDSTKCVSEISKDLSDGPPFAKKSFDKILLDGPCSVLGKRPQFVNKITAKSLKSYPQLQKKLFANAVNLLKPGGLLVYSTCTIAASENEGIVAWALRKYPQLALRPAKPLLGGPGWPNVGLNDEQRIMVQRFGPEKDPLRLTEEIYRNSIGFFIASFEKIKND